VTVVCSHALLPQVTTEGKDDYVAITAVVAEIFSPILVCVGRLYPKPIA
jgi:hypothetical protein